MPEENKDMKERQKPISRSQAYADWEAEKEAREDERIVAMALTSHPEQPKKVQAAEVKTPSLSESETLVQMPMNLPDRK